MENLPRRGFRSTCCACMSFALVIVRDSPMVNFVSLGPFIRGKIRRVYY